MSSLDGGDRILGNTYGYRDGRTKGMDKEVYKIITGGTPCMPGRESRNRCSITILPADGGENPGAGEHGKSGVAVDAS